jgi:hypothetical protein
VIPSRAATWSARPPGARHRGVPVGPGATTLTWTPRGAQKSAYSRESECSAALATE